MNSHQLLGQLSRIQRMMTHLLESVPADEGCRRFATELPPLAWLFGRAVYLETYWVREVLAGDRHMTGRVERLFGAEVEPDDALCRQLPPRDHLLNWALELQDENLTRLANPRMLPTHPLCEGDRHLYLILHSYAELYELMLAQLTARQVETAPEHRVERPLRALAPSLDHADVHRGVYRIGAKDDPAARDNELPPQVVELDAFRIDRAPVSNGAFLGFMEAGGYGQREWWSEAGWAWREGQSPQPFHWRRDPAGEWYGIGLNGPFDLIAEEPVAGLGLHEAVAYANWVAGRGGRLAGAVLQHEYQWEVAMRSQALTQSGRVWEWCSNPFHAYDGYRPPAEAEAASRFDAGHYSLRGGSLHSQPLLRRASQRRHAPAEQRSRVSGTRLVFPASDMPWHTTGH